MIFEIKRMEDNRYGCIIFSTSYINPFDNIKEIEEELKNDNYEGDVIFDVYLSHINENKRYIEGYFNGISFEKDKFKWLTTVNDNIKKISNNFLNNNQKYLEDSLLTTVDKMMISINNN